LNHILMSDLSLGTLEQTLRLSVNNSTSSAVRILIGIVLLSFALDIGLSDAHFGKSRAILLNSQISINAA